MRERMKALGIAVLACLCVFSAVSCGSGVSGTEPAETVALEPDVSEQAEKINKTYTEDNGNRAETADESEEPDADADMDTAESEENVSDETVPGLEGEDAGEEETEPGGDGTDAETEDISKPEDTQSDTAELMTVSEAEAEQEARGQTYTVTDETKTMYTTAVLNVRRGPSIEYDRIGTYKNGAEVMVTGICNETGWSCVECGGTEDWCCSDYLTDAKPVSSDASAMKAETAGSAGAAADTSEADTAVSDETYTSGGFPFWNYSWHSGVYIGRMRIPSVGVNVGLYNTNAQSAIDAWDSAAIDYHWDSSHDVYEYSTVLCADHNYQGFIAIAGCTVGCDMYIDGTDGQTYKYVCDRIDYNGYNTGYGLNDCSGNSANYTGGIWCYTCHTDSLSNIYMVHFIAV